MVGQPQIEGKQPAPMVLVADDEVNTTIMLQHIFEREGYRVKTVTNGIAALETAKRIVPDLILLDILMPGMNGFDVLRLLREDPETVNIPTIMVTANAREPADVARGLKLGADDYLYKPFAPQELLARAQSKIKARQLEEALHRRTQQLEALLRVSEKLNQSLAVRDLLDLILELVHELLPADVAVIDLLAQDCSIVERHVRDKAGSGDAESIDHEAIVARAIRSDHAIQWAGDTTNPYRNGMALTLQHASERIAVLSLLSKAEPYEDQQLPLFEGIGRQASLALRNAQLYALQADNAMRLEEMVKERTKELESAHKLLIRSEKLASIGRLGASIAHEIRNPLMPIGLFLEDLETDLARNRVQLDPKEVRMIRENVERIERIVRSLLEFARDSGPDLHPLDVTQLLEGIIKLNRKFFEHERVTVKESLPPLPPVLGSKDQLEAVFMNLALNAEAAMDDGGTLTINARQESGQIVIDFIDTGCGIPPDEIDRIFDPFYSTKPQGTGLGLFLSFGIIEGHHGSISVKSTVGVGTHFTLRLPIYTPQ